MKLKQSIDLNLIGNARELGGYPTADAIRHIKRQKEAFL